LLLRPRRTPSFLSVAQPLFQDILVIIIVSIHAASATVNKSGRRRDKSGKNWVASKAMATMGKCS
jgi:hypothetical protein